MSGANRVLAVTMLLAALVAGTGTAQDQGPSDRPNAFSFDVASPTYAVIQALQSPSTRVLWRVPIVLDYQRVLTDKLVLAVALSINDSLTSDSQAFYMGDFVGLVTELDWHPFDVGMNGFYVGGELFASGGSGMTYFIGAGDAGFTRSLQLGLGVAVGYEFSLPASLLLNVAVGAGAGWSFSENTTSVALSNTMPYSFLTTVPTRLELSLGYRF